MENQLQFFWNTAPHITIAVCVRNGEATIAACLESLLQLKYPADKRVILVVENASDDNTLQIVSRFPVRLVRESRIGRVYARNTALRETSTEFIAFTDADCIADPNWLSDIIPVFHDSAVAAAGGKIITSGEEFLARYYEKRQIVSNKEFHGDYPYSPPFLATANLVLRVECARLMGGFSEGFQAGEDADLCWKLQKSGYRTIYVDGGMIYHKHRTTSKGLFSQSVEYAYYGVQLFITHPDLMPHKYWIWYGLYVRWIVAVMKLTFIGLIQDSYSKKEALYDVIRYSGTIIGRLKAALSLRALVL